MGQVQIIKHKYQYRIFNLGQNGEIKCKILKLSVSGERY